jgi:hypothetical protein
VGNASGEPMKMPSPFSLVHPYGESLLLEMTIGSDLLRITRDAITYKGTRIPAEEVDRCRWGVYKHYINGVRVQRAYTIWLTGPGGAVTIECARPFHSDAQIEKRYQAVIEKVWQVVGARLWRAHLKALASGGQIAYGPVVVDRAGITLPCHRFLRRSLPAVFPWEQVVSERRNGLLRVAARSDGSAWAELSYRDVDNVHVLDALIQFLCRDGNRDPNGSAERSRPPS